MSAFAARELGGSTPPARILVVDDDPHLRQLLAEYFTDDGHLVREAGNGAEALSVAQSWRPDVILLDLMMPVMNGWQFAEAYAGTPGAHAPIVVLTAAGPGAIQSALGLQSVSAALPKPIDLDALQDVVAAQLGRTQR